MKCECCDRSEAICDDYRPRKDLHESKFEYTYKTPLSCYTKYLVCNECFHAEDKRFFQSLAKTEKQLAEKDA
jgi:hypothetical protein